MVVDFDLDSLAADSKFKGSIEELIDRHIYIICFIYYFKREIWNSFPLIIILIKNTMNL